MNKTGNAETYGGCHDIALAQSQTMSSIPVSKRGKLPVYLFGEKASGEFC